VAIFMGGMAAGAASIDPTASEQYAELQGRNREMQVVVADQKERYEALEDSTVEREAELEEREAAVEAADAEVAAAKSAVAKREAAVAGAEAKAKANTITDGTWSVGTDIAAGTYRTTDEVGSSCYWAILAGGTNGSDILENDIPGGGRPMVTLAEGQDFNTKRCGSWQKQ
jgi:multidrug efflux pump subunit AcrA (membrane-fusion protein)